MKIIFSIILSFIIFTNNVNAQQHETVGIINGNSFARNSEDENEYTIVRSDKDGRVVWIKQLPSERTSVFDASLDLYMVFGYTTLSGNKITSNPGDYDYWLVIKSKNIESLIYPNPTRTNIFVFTNNISNNVRITLFDATNKEIMTERLLDFTTSIKLPPLSQGIYFYRIENDNLIIKTGSLCIN